VDENFDETDDAHDDEEDGPIVGEEAPDGDIAPEIVDEEQDADADEDEGSGDGTLSHD
jgi:hypothetical protein